MANTVVEQAYVLSNGIPTTLPPFTVGFNCSTQGNGTPYLAGQATIEGSTIGIVQCQADTVGVTNLTNTPLSVAASFKSIPGYQNINDLGTFPPAQTVTLQPGVNTVISASKPVPEPRAPVQ